MSFVTRVAATAALLVGVSASASAALLYDINAVSPGSPFAGFPGNWGFQFLTTSTVNVASLGLWDQGSDGLSAPHSVGIFHEGTLLTSTTVSNGSTVVSSANVDGRWLFTDLMSPYTLPAGNYVLGFFNAADFTDDFRGYDSVTFMSGATFSNALARSGATSFAAPDYNSGLSGWFGPNLQTTAVPEPGVTAMMVFGAVSANWNLAPADESYFLDNSLMSFRN